MTRLRTGVQGYITGVRAALRKALVAAEPEDALTVAGYAVYRTEQADRDVEEMRVNVRWGKAQVAFIKRAAALYGML